MAAVPPGDPRVAAAGGNPGSGSVAPVVALPRGGPSWIVIAIGMAILGVLLFSVLDSRRRAAEVPAVRVSASDRAAGSSAAPPALYVPPAPPPPAPVVEAAPEPVRQLPPPPPQIIYVPQPAPPQPQQQVEPSLPPARGSADPALVYDGTAGDAGSAPAAATADKEGAAEGANAGAGATSIAGSRARAGVLANRTTTVPQGTLIPAVLETGLDSTRPGLARAMVTRDVRGFYGTRILIPRGRRLIGEYRSEAQPGQKRALVNWVRLIRPDGVTIAIGSPAGDPLGRGGIGARVNNHFFARFTGAILQSVLDIGVNLASREAGSPLIVALPGTVQNVSQPLTQQNQQVTPTLTVKPGTSITIFVARDLDFTGAGGRR